jgi:hypothetical protein
MSKSESEKIALKRLEKYWPDYKPGFEDHESPDWINKTYDIGLEITSCTLPGEGEEKGINERLKGKTLKELKAEYKRVKGSNRDIILLNETRTDVIFWDVNEDILLQDSNEIEYCEKYENYKFFISIGGLFNGDAWSKFSIIQLDKKLLKLNNNYKICKTNILYITDAEIFPDKLDITIFEMIKKQKEFKIKFDIIILDQYSSLYMIYKNEKIDKIEIKI